MTHGLARSSRALGALADPTRRSVFEQVARGPVAVGELARMLPVTRPSVSQHLRALKDAGLVTETAVGTRRIYRIDPRGVAAMRNWLEELWAQSLANFATLADAEEQSD